MTDFLKYKNIDMNNFNTLTRSMVIGQLRQALGLLESPSTKGMEICFELGNNEVCFEFEDEAVKD